MFTFNSSQRRLLLEFFSMRSSSNFNRITVNYNHSLSLLLTIMTFLISANSQISHSPFAFESIDFDTNASASKKVLQNLNGLRLNVIGAPEAIVKRYEYFGIFQNLPPRDIWSFVNYHLFRDLKNMLNFTDNHLNFSKEVDLIYAFDKGVDFQLNQRIMARVNVTQIQYLHATYSIKIRLFFSQPPSQSLRNIFQVPFRFYLWIAAFLSFVLIFLTLIILIKFGTQDVWDYFDSIFWILSCICQQGWFKSPSSFRMRVVCGVTLLTTLTLYISYCAEIISQLTDVVPIETISDLNKYNFILGTSDAIGGGAAVNRHLDAMLTSRIGSFKTIKILDACNVMKTIRSSRVALLSYPYNFYDNVGAIGFDRTELCKSQVSIIVDNVPYPEAMVVPKGSALKEPMNQRILLIKERGVFSRYIRYYDNGLALSCNAKKFKHSVSYVDIFTAYVFIGFGLIISLVLLIGEILAKYYGRRGQVSTSVLISW